MGDEKTWAQKRKENLIARAQGKRSESKDAEITITAVTFATKLQLRAKMNRLEAESGTSNSSIEESWLDKRKKNYLARHDTRPKPSEVSLQAMMFASKLQHRARRSRGLREESEKEEMTGRGAAQLEQLPSKPFPPTEKSWQQKRKETYLARKANVRREQPTQADIAVTAIAFAAKLRARNALTRSTLEEEEFTRVEDDAPASCTGQG